MHVDADTSHPKSENPYDVAWEYGTEYEKYVEAVNWSLLFDAKFYKETFPLLAMLYHNDDALLLRHFQTVGIHEGRQGNERFNVQAYQKNCSSAVRKAFGDNYEGYYFYYALNQKTEKKVTTSGIGYKKQLAVKLTAMQAKELENINQYRKEVNAAPVKFDPELAAVANFRAYVDADEHWHAHDWVGAHPDETDAFMDYLGTRSFSENTVSVTHSRDHRLSAWYINFRNSKSHYDAMVRPKFAYTGTSNAYVGNAVCKEPTVINEKGDLSTPSHTREFDVYVPDLKTAYHDNGPQ